MYMYHYSCLYMYTDTYTAISIISLSTQCGVIKALVKGLLKCQVREGGREGGRERGMEGERKGGREGGREGGRGRMNNEV